MLTTSQRGREIVTERREREEGLLRASGDAPGMSRRRKSLFVATAHFTADAADYFGLPRDRTVITGSRIEV